MSQITAETLITHGFRDIGVWCLPMVDGGIDYCVDDPNAKGLAVMLSERNSLYAFVHGDQVKYIGKTTQTIRERFTGYRHPHRRQITNWRCNGKIREMLELGEEIRILVFNPISLLHYGDFDINLAAGLEDSLIAKFKPVWNGREGGRVLTEEAERESVDESKATTDASPYTSVVPPTESLTGGATLIAAASFAIVLGEAYYRQGLINPGVEASKLIGDDGDPIEIRFDDGTEPIISRINRKANVNGTVRVVGRNRQIAEWFHDHFSEDDTVEARVLGRHHILLLSKSAHGQK